MVGGGESASKETVMVLKGIQRVESKQIDKGELQDYRDGLNGQRVLIMYGTIYIE